MRTIPQISGALHFSTRGEYGVRLMVELARHRGTGPVSLADISDHEDLPRPYLEQLVISLREAGLVVSTRGARGGYELSRDARDIRMSQVIEALEGPISPMVCATDHGSRRPGPSQSRAAGPRSATSSRCGSRSASAVMGALESMTLADLAGPGPDPPVPLRCPSTPRPCRSLSGQPPRSPSHTHECRRYRRPARRRRAAHR